MNLNNIFNRFCQLIDVSEKLKLTVIDLKIVAIKELQIAINKMDYSDDLMNNIEYSLALLKNRGIIFDYERLEDGFKIILENKIYANENELIIKFDKK
jgi:hypothetical protein